MFLDIRRWKLLFCVLFILSNLSIGLSLRVIWPCVRVLSLDYSDVLEPGAKCTQQIFFYALPGSRRHFRVYAPTGWPNGEKPWRRTCYTRVRERHVPLGAASRPRLMFQRCRVRRRSCCSLYHRDLGGINRKTRLFDRDQRVCIPEVLHSVICPKQKSNSSFDRKNHMNLN